MPSYSNPVGNTFTVKPEQRYIAHMHIVRVPCIRGERGRPFTGCETDEQGAEFIRVIVPLNRIHPDLEYIETVHFGVFLGSTTHCLMGYIRDFLHPWLEIDHERDWREDKVSFLLASMGISTLPNQKTRKLTRIDPPMQFIDYKQYFESYTVEKIWCEKKPYIISSPYEDEINLPRSIQIRSRANNKVKVTYGYSNAMDE